MRPILTAILLSVFSSIFARNTTEATDSLLHFLKTPHTTSQQKVQLYRNLADIHFDTPQYKTYLWAMYTEASKIEDKPNMLEALDDIVVAEVKSKKNDSIIKYTQYIKQIATPKETCYLLSLYRMRLFESRYYSAKGEEAINEELSFLDIKTEKPYDIYKEIASAYNIGTSFYMDRQFEKAIPYLDKATQQTELLPEKEKFVYQKFIIWRLCYAYAQAGKNAESVKIMEKLINLVEQTHKNECQKRRPFYAIELYLIQYYSFMLANIPYLTLEQEKHYWNKTQAIGAKLTNDIDKYNYYLCANNYYSHNHTKIDMPKAIAANDSLIKIAKKLAPRNLPGLYKVNSSLYELTKDYPNALKFLKIAHHIQDSLTTETANKQLNELQVKYDINSLNNEKALLEVKNKKIQVISLSVLLIVLISISAYLYFSLKKERKMKLELKVLHAKAQESEKMKQEFINSICHEIRTPLNGIVGFSDLIMNEDIDIEMRREFPAEIQKSTVLLTSLVNSMLEVANLDVSEEKLPCTSIDLSGICIQEMEQIKRKPDIEYKLDIAEESTFIMTNHNYLAQVIGHLLDNANKFTEQGQITLSYQINKALKKVQISVTDTGRGIPTDKREVVFDRFYKVDSFVPGNGLGLYLCQLIIRRLSGEIWIDPEYTTGIRMIVTLPIA